jgi:ketosteroid isomerase-like protein
VAKRDFSAMREVLDPDVVLDMSRNVFNPDVYRGDDGFIRWAGAIEDMWDDFEAEAEEIIDAGDSVVTAVRISGRGRGSGVDVEMRVFNVWAFREGRVLRLTGGYRDRSEAMSDAGGSG